MDDAPTPMRRAFRATIDDVSKNRRSVAAKINTNCVDRYRTVIVPGGGDFRAFMSTPAVLWEHGMDPTRGRMPIGHCTSVKYRKAEDDILAVTQFKNDEYSDQIFENFVDGTLTAFSVDFLPDMTASSAPTPEEVRNRPEWGGAQTVYRRWELAGYSAVSYPGNPEALAVAVERGLWVPDEVRSQLPKRDMAEGSGSGGGYATEPDTDGDDDQGGPKRYITHEGEKWVVHAEDGKVLGEHDSKADAEKQLAAVEAHKHKKSAPEAQDTDAETGDEETMRSIPEGITTYTTEQLATILGRTVFDPMFAIFDRQLKDAEDLARGRV